MTCLLSQVVMLASLYAGTEFEEDLAALRQLRSGRDTDFDSVEEYGQRLLDQKLTPDQRGRLCYEMAHIYAQTGLQFPDRLESYATQAMDLPLKETLRLRLYVYRGDSHVANREAPFAERRLLAARIYLEGLIECQDIDTFPLPKPKHNKRGGLIGNEDIEGHHKRAEAFRKTFELWQEREELAYSKRVLEQQITQVYETKPYAIDELKTLMTDSDLIPDFADRIVATVEEYMAEHPPRSEQRSTE